MKSFCLIGLLIFNVLAFASEQTNNSTSPSQVIDSLPQEKKRTPCHFTFEKEDTSKDTSSTPNCPSLSTPLRKLAQEALLACLAPDYKNFKFYNRSKNGIKYSDKHIFLNANNYTGLSYGVQRMSIFIDICRIGKEDEIKEFIKTLPHYLALQLSIHGIDALATPLVNCKQCATEWADHLMRKQPNPFEFIGQNDDTLKQHISLLSHCYQSMKDPEILRKERACKALARARTFSNVRCFEHDPAQKNCTIKLTLSEPIMAALKIAALENEPSKNDHKEELTSCCLFDGYK